MLEVEGSREVHGESGTKSVATSAGQGGKVLEHQGVQLSGSFMYQVLFLQLPSLWN